MNFNLLDMDFRIQAQMLLPPRLRSTSMVDFLGSLLKPLTSLLAGDKDEIIGVATRAQWNGQKMVFQAALNYVFGITIAPFIIIETIEDTNVTMYAYSTASTNQNYAYPKGFYFTSWAYPKAVASTPTGYDFLVKMPAAYATTENLALLEQQVKLIKVTGKTYEITTY